MPFLEVSSIRYMCQHPMNLLNCIVPVSLMPRLDNHLSLPAKGSHYCNLRGADSQLARRPSQLPASKYV